MRRFLVLAPLLALALPAAAAALEAVHADGTVVVRGGDGTVTLRLDRGAVVGRMVRGTLRVIEPQNGDCNTPLVWEDGFRAEGSERFLNSGAFVCEFRGRDMRFRLVGGNNDATLTGSDIFVSAVGRGSGRLRGRGGPDDGRYSLNGDAFAPLPDTWTRFVLGGS